MDRKLQKNKCVIYMRVGNMDPMNRQEEISKQYEKCLNFSQEIKYTVVDQFVDFGSANKPLSERCGLKHMVAFLNQNEEVKSIVCTNPDRISRNFFDFVLLKNLFQNMGIHVKCINPGKKRTELDILSDFYRTIRHDDMCVLKELKEDYDL